MKSAGALVLWIALAALCAVGLADALQPLLTSQALPVCLIAYAAVMVTLLAYTFIRDKRVHWPSLYIAVAVASGLAGSLLLTRPDSVPDGTAFMAMGVSIFVVCLLWRPRRS